MKSLWTSWPAVQKRIASKKHVLLLLDFDGTLAPITKNPRMAVVPEKIRKLLRILSHRKDFIVAIISGRSLKDVRSRIRIPNVIYIGNHGLEIAGKDARLPLRTIRQRTRFPARRLVEIFRKAFYFWPGILVEDKVYTLSLHFRNLPRDRKPVFDELITFYRRKFRGRPIVWKKGKKVWEIRPFPEWGKGDVVSYLSGKFPKALPVAVGDDKTDEDMFSVLKAIGITIRVGHSKRSSARYFVRSPKEVGVLLQRLSGYEK